MGLSTMREEREGEGPMAPGWELGKFLTAQFLSHASSMAADPHAMDAAQATNKVVCPCPS